MIGRESRSRPGGNKRWDMKGVLEIRPVLHDWLPFTVSDHLNKTKTGELLKKSCPFCNGSTEELLVDEIIFWRAIHLALHV